jgi:hypothetical protein
LWRVYFGLDCIGRRSLRSSAAREIRRDTATITSSGGIDDTMKQKTLNVYTTAFSLSGVRLDADASATPRTLTVVEVQRGCKWNAVAP